MSLTKKNKLFVIVYSLFAIVETLLSIDGTGKEYLPTLSGVIIILLGITAVFTLLTAIFWDGLFNKLTVKVNVEDICLFLATPLIILIGQSYGAETNWARVCLWVLFIIVETIMIFRGDFKRK